MKHVVYACKHSSGKHEKESSVWHSPIYSRHQDKNRNLDLDEAEFIMPLVSLIELPRFSLVLPAWPAGSKWPSSGHTGADWLATFSNPMMPARK